MTWELALAGLGIGTLVGFTGMGGGSLLAPLLVLVFGFNPTVAIGTDILHGAVFKSVGALRHRAIGTVHARLSGWMIVTSAPMSLVGVALATWLDRHTDSHEIGTTVLGIALLVGSLGLLGKSIVRSREHPAGNFAMTRRDRIAALIIGFFGGLIVGLTSVGTGVFFGLTMLIVFPLRSAKVVGTDIFHAAALLWVAGLGHLVAGNVRLDVVAWLLIGSIPGVLLGSQLTIKIPDRSLRALLATLLAVVGIKLADVPSAEILQVIAFAAGLGVFAWTVIGNRSLRAQPTSAQEEATGDSLAIDVPGRLS